MSRSTWAIHGLTSDEGVTVADGATLRTGGGWTASMLVQGFLDIALPATDPATDRLDLAGDVDLDGGTLSLDLRSGGMSDKLALTGMFTAGGTIDINLEGLFMPGAGEVFDVLDFSIFVEGIYAFDFNDAPLAGGLAWDTSAFSTTGVLSVVASPVPEPLACAGAVPLAMLMLRRRKMPLA